MINSNNDLNVLIEQSQYSLNELGFNKYTGDLGCNINVNKLAELIDIKHDGIKRIDTRTFYKNVDNNKILKKKHNLWFNCVRLELSLNSRSVIIDIFSNGKFIIINCLSLSDAKSAIEKLLFEINSNSI